MRHLFALAALALAACSPGVVDGPEQWREIAVETTPVDLGVETLGALRFRGGVEIASADVAFGGLSDFEVLEDDRIIAISDNGDWFEAQLVLDEAGALIGVRDVRTAFMRGEDGRAFTTKRDGDSEDLAQLPDGRIAVSFEQRQIVRIYDFNRDGPFGAATRGPSLAGVERLHRNAGLEAMTSTADGSLLIGAEGGEEPTTPLWLAPLDAREPVVARFQYPLAAGYSLTGLDRLPNGDFVAIERFYAPVIGARARITMFPAASLATEGTLANVVELAHLAPPLLVDNFEGIATRLMSDGATRIYILSDNNFRSRQRTLLYAFDVSSTPR